MKYLLLIYEDENNPPPDDAETAQWFEYTQALRDAGAHLAGEALHPTSAATTVAPAAASAVASPPRAAHRSSTRSPRRAPTATATHCDPPSWTQPPSRMEASREA